jgi:hypothetical protein
MEDKETYTEYISSSSADFEINDAGLSKDVRVQMSVSCSLITSMLGSSIYLFLTVVSSAKTSLVSCVFSQLWYSSRSERWE